MDHLLAIRTFQRIVETRSFTKAAAHLGLPRSTVSKSLKELEEHLGIKLIHRTTRSVTLTIEGAEYYQRMSRLVAKLDETEIAIREVGAAAKGKLRIDLHSSLANFVLIPILAEFRDRYPYIQLALGVGDRPVSLIEEGVDCVIRAGKLADSSLIGRTLYKDRLVTCASPAYLERFGIPRNVSDLDKGHKVVGYFSAATGEAWPLRFCNRSEEKQVLNFDIAANDSASLINMLVQGMGIGQTHASVAKNFIQSGQLVPILEDSTNTEFPVSIIYPPTKQLNARLRIFIDWMLERLSGYH